MVAPNSHCLKKAPPTLVGLHSASILGTPWRRAFTLAQAQVAPNSAERACIPLAEELVHAHDNPAPPLCEVIVWS